MLLVKEELETLQLMCRAALKGSDVDIFDLFSALNCLDRSDGLQFRDWLKEEDPILYARVKRAQKMRRSKLSETDQQDQEPKQKPWYAQRIERARGSRYAS